MKKTRVIATTVRRTVVEVIVAVVVVGAGPMMAGQVMDTMPMEVLKMHRMVVHPPHPLPPTMMRGLRMDTIRAVPAVMETTIMAIVVHPLLLLLPAMATNGTRMDGSPAIWEMEAVMARVRRWGSRPIALSHLLLVRW